MAESIDSVHADAVSTCTIGFMNEVSAKEARTILISFPCCIFLRYVSITLYLFQDFFNILVASYAYDGGNIVFLMTKLIQNLFVFDVYPVFQ